MTRKNEFIYLFNIIADPQEVYNGIAREPKWKMPVSAFILLYVVAGYLMVQPSLVPMKRVFDASFGGMSTDAAVAGVKMYLFIGELFVKPLKIVVRWGLLTLLVIVCSPASSRRESGFPGKVFSAIAYSEMIFALMNVLTLLFIYARGLDAIDGEGDLVIFKGLEYFLGGREVPPFVIGVASHMTIFSLWYVILLSLGIAVIARIGRRHGVFIASAGWIVWSCFDELSGRLLSSVV